MVAADVLRGPKASLCRKFLMGDLHGIPSRTSGNLLADRVPGLIATWTGTR